MNTLEEQVVACLKEKKLSLATAESCTGGLIASKLVNVAGISEVFWGGFVTYANEAKVKLLGVSEELLREKGAVCAEVAASMAKGAAETAGAMVSVASTGIAGPDGGTSEKPVGLVYLGCFCCGKIKVIRCQFQGGRQQVREAAVNQALELVLECIKVL